MALANPPDSGPVERGRRIYRQGIGAAPIVAALSAGESADPTQVAASVLPCAGCHGRDRRGRPEGGVNPSDLTWDSLTDPAGATTAAGRHRPSYTERLLKRAIALGIDPAGQSLHVAMPRYQLTQTDMADLLAYLETAADPEPGVADTSVVLGVLLPPGDPLPETQRAVRQALATSTGEIHAQGDLYGRRIELRLVEAPAHCAELPAVVADLARSAFALVAPFAVGCEEELAAAAEREEIPVVGPLVLAPPVGTSRLVFDLDSGPAKAAPALARLARRRFEGTPPPAAILHPAGSPPGIVGAFRDAATGAGFAPPIAVELPAAATPPAFRDLTTKLHEARIGLVFFLGPAADLAGFQNAAHETGGAPRLLAPGTTATPASAAAAAVTAARLFVEGARRAGHDLTRDRLVAALSGLYKFEPGGSPAITFGSGRRTGVHGTPFRWIEPGSTDTTAEAGWIELDGPVLPSHR